ncbi:transcription factor bHLH96-like [Tripterygium wilfordii]|uniref:Transcription factor bHLH96-like n=1 Tax=Tripterygium wilfordii TaxID=458696 RepID=A0A7J7DTZ9_TRIWF|nr:transcription factor bHLH94-like [Tripterygium wilfordii]KAF5749769.1 transcription factor bHLH96-like [Tripterygium wilfordii]
MALEAVVFPQEDPLFIYGCKDTIQHQLQNSDGIVFNTDNWKTQDAYLVGKINVLPVVVAAAPPRRPKRRRFRSMKNKEEAENQRRTHIVVERNRRKQMNDYLNLLRSIMPSSYSQSGDQASIIGGAINYVKELEQLLQTLEAKKRISQQSAADTNNTSLFSDFFTFPQYSTWSNSHHEEYPLIKAEKRFVNVADVEVRMVEKHANIKILSEKQPKRLMKIIGGLHSHGLTILHLNVTTLHKTVLYCVNVKVEDDCKLNSVNEIAAAVYEMVGGVHEGQEEAES